MGNYGGSPSAPLEISNPTAPVGASSADKTAVPWELRACLAGPGASRAGFAGHGNSIEIAVAPAGGNVMCCGGAPRP